MEYHERYTDAELQHIVEQGLIYMCACPAQVAEALRKLRELHDYQRRCQQNPENDARVHEAISRSTIQAHATLQDCLDEVIALEQWDRATLEMPPHLRKRQMQSMLSSDD
jgi:glutamyl/glutaminyl-tRNA synthetase